jgi:uncharacterized protein YndB with AHSA1/START domain
MSAERPWLDTGPETAAVVQITRHYPAPRDRVFRAWTDPALFRRWFTPVDGTSPSAEMNVQPGGRYRIEMKPPPELAPTTYVVGTYLEVEPPERLVYTFVWEQLPPDERLAEVGLDGLDELESRVTVEFRDLGEATEVCVTHERLDTADLRAFHRWGWRSSMDKLAEVV